MVTDVRVLVGIGVSDAVGVSVVVGSGEREGVSDSVPLAEADVRVGGGV